MGDKWKHGQKAKSKGKRRRKSRRRRRWPIDPNVWQIDDVDEYSLKR